MSKSSARPLSDAPAGKREAVLKAAGALFLQVGFGAASMDVIARSAGVSKATVYAHFASKEALFAAMLEEGTRARFGDLDADIEADAAGDDIAAGLRAIGRKFVAMALSPGGIAIYRVVVAESARFPELGRAFYDNAPSVMRDSIERFLKRAVRRGQLVIDDPRIAGDQFVGMIKGDLYVRLLLGLIDEINPAEAEQVIEQAVHTFLAAFRPR
ncbi:MAG TPA: TetR/AcrR family transcriptional regulator [Candidatus Sulfotelmatobacter sp.]|nr:TetR/AcrR family transcriptional regulator [Candidatus Sulfotelmatobacter sp.]